MKLLTFKLDTGDPSPSRMDDCLEALGHLVQAKRPEFIALQNVTNENIKKVTGSTWAARYKVIQPPYKFETRKKPSVALLSTYPAQDYCTITYHDTPTVKTLLKGYYVMYDKFNKAFVVCVATTSLEQGLKAADYREKQLNEACLSMIDDADGFLLGDMGLDNDIDGELTLRGGWMDAWLSIPGNTESNGYTYNPEKNALIKEDPFGPGRPDRIFFKSDHFKLDSMELVGVEPYQQARGGSVTISKHYGLFMQLSHRDPEEPKTKVEQTMVAAIFKKTEWSVQFKENQ